METIITNIYVLKTKLCTRIRRETNSLVFEMYVGCTFTLHKEDLSIRNKTISCQKCLRNIEGSHILEMNV